MNFSSLGHKLRLKFGILRNFELQSFEFSRAIALMMEAMHTSETLVHFNMTTRYYIPDD
jgi:hypothetical protein